MIGLDKKLFLYYYDGCFFCTKVLNYIKKHNITNIELKDTNKDNNRQNLIKYGLSPQVPCLEIKLVSGNKWLYESDDIIDYISKN